MRSRVDAHAVLCRDSDHLLSVAVHELRTPVTCLSLRLDLLIRKTMAGHFDVPAASASLMEDLKLCKSLTANLAQLIDEILDVSRIRDGKDGLNLQSIDLRKVVRKVVTELTKGLDLGAIEVVAPEAVIGQWDPSGLRRIMSNLLCNAIKYGQGRLIRIEVALDAPEDAAILWVSDQGEGIERGKQGQLFDQYERADLLREGTGLGLYICRQLVEAHGGEITVESEPGKGSTFRVKLPRSGSSKSKPGSSTPRPKA